VVPVEFPTDDAAGRLTGASLSVCAGVGASRSLLVVVFGLPGTGKSTLAVTLAQHIPAVAPSRDAVRQEIGPPILSPASPDYADAIGRVFRRRQTQRLETMVDDELGADRPVVLEHVADRDARRRLEAPAAKHGAPAFSIEVICSDARELTRRLRARRGNWQRVVAQMSKTYEPASDALVVDSRDAPEEMVRQAVVFVRAAGPFDPDS
jgi:predicted kinase